MQYLRLFFVVILMENSYKIGRIFGIDIRIHVSWIIIFLLITVNLAVGLFPGLYPDRSVVFHWLLGFVGSIIFFVSLLAHEMAHSLVAKARGLNVSQITLFLLGGVSNIEKEPDSPSTEFLMAVVGPATSVVIGIVFLFISRPMLGGLDPQTVTPSEIATRLSPFQLMLLWLGMVNILVGIFNLLPGFPLDGGRILRSAIWAFNRNLESATRISSYLGQAVGYLFIFGGLLMIFGFAIPVFGKGVAGGLWIAIIGWFLTNAARQSYKQVVIMGQLENLRVRDLMRTDFKTVDESLPLEDFVDTYLIGSDDSSYVVEKEGKISGIISLSDLQKIARPRWPEKIVKDAMTRLPDLETASPDDEINDVLRRMSRKNIHQIPVMQEGEIVGLVSRRDIFLWLKMKKSE